LKNSPIFLTFAEINFGRMALHNRVNKKELKARLQQDTTPRKTISFYRYVILPETQTLRNELYALWNAWGILGRIYLAYEGINAQMSIPLAHYDQFINYLNSTPEFAQMPIKEGVEDDGKSFYKLAIKVRKKIVADGLADNTFDVTNVGTHLTAEEFNRAMDLPDTIVVDLRNHYESEIGHFEGAILPQADTFREELPMVVEQLKDKKDKKVLLYCTGGVRCEKASAYLKHEGFEDVNQLHGGIIEYAKEIKRKGIPSKFKGKNFVFDERLGERITSDVIAHCHQCGQSCDQHTNCANDDCHLLFIQCDNCKETLEGCCSTACIDIIHLPLEEQVKLRRGRKKTDSLSVYKSRLRPNLSEMIKNRMVMVKKS
jgi:UPF0176 protein